MKNQNRYAISLILKIKDNQLIDYQVKETTVHVRYNYHYEQFDELISNYQKVFKKDEHEHAYLSFLKTTKAFLISFICEDKKSAQRRFLEMITMITNNWRKISPPKNLKLSLRCAGGGTRNTTNGTGVLLVLVILV